MPYWEHDGTTFNPLHWPWAAQCIALQTDRQTDRRHHHAKSRSYCVQYDRLKSSHLHRTTRCQFLARDSIYAIARYMLSPVRLSVTRVDQSITVEVRIMQLLPPVAHSLYFLRYKFNPEILISDGFPWAWASNKGGVGKTNYFLPLCVDISKTVRDMTKETINY